METAITQVRFEYLQETLGLGNKRPRISWMVVTAIPDWRQRSYQVQAYQPGGQRHDQSSQVASRQSTLVALCPTHIATTSNRSCQDVGCYGTAVPDHVMSPSWTSYQHRLRYQTFDIISLLPDELRAHFLQFVRRK